MATIDVGGRDVTVALTGPECSGKTTLAQWLGELLAVPVVPELARDMLTPGRGYTQSDLLDIIKAQLTLEAEYRAAHRGLLICDTDRLVLQIWWQEKFGVLPDALASDPEIAINKAYLLTQPDLPWQADPLRENPHDRERLYQSYRQQLDQAGSRYAVVSGSGEERQASALAGLVRLTQA